MLLKKETKAKAFPRRSRPCGLSALIIFERLLYPPRQAWHQRIQLRVMRKQETSIPWEGLPAGGVHEHAFET
jgi:hypothetical protein